VTKFIDAGSSGEWGWHATETAMRCPQLFAYHHRITPPPLAGGDRAPLLRGSLVHQGLAHHYARMQAAQEGKDPDIWATPDVPSRPTDAALAERAERIYTERLKDYLEMLTKFAWVEKKMRDAQ
jgi:hypothetical protein